MEKLRITREQKAVAVAREEHTQLNSYAQKVKSAFQYVPNYRVCHTENGSTLTDQLYFYNNSSGIIEV